MGASVISVYIRVVMPANRLRVNHMLRFYGTSLHVENFLKSQCVLVSSGNYSCGNYSSGNYSIFNNYLPMSR